MNRKGVLRNRSSLAIAGLLIALGLLVFSLFFSRSSIFAQNQDSSQSIEVSPPSQEVTADPGRTVLVKSKIRNRSQASLPLTVRIEDFTASGEEGQVALESQGPYSLASWTKLTPASFTLAPGEEQEVTAEIKVPGQKVAGGYYGSFVYKVTTPQKGGAASIGQEIASLFLLKVNGQVSEKLFLDQFKAPFFTEFGPVPFSLKLTNTGNVHTKAFGLVNVTDMFGQKVADLVIPGTNVFPGASRVVNVALDKKFLFGKYTATAIVYFGSVDNQTLTSVTSFMAVPLRIIAAAIIVLVLLFILRKRIGKALKALFG